MVTHFLPHLNRDAVYRILRAEGLNRLPPANSSRKPHGEFKEYDIGFLHMDVKHLPKLRDKDGSSIPHIRDPEDYFLISDHQPARGLSEAAFRIVTAIAKQLPRDQSKIA